MCEFLGDIISTNLAISRPSPLEAFLSGYSVQECSEPPDVAVECCISQITATYCVVLPRGFEPGAARLPRLWTERVATEPREQ